MRTKHVMSLVSLAFAFWCLAASPWPATADDTEKGTAPPQKSEKKSDSTKKVEKDTTLAIVGGDVYTIAHDIIRGGTVIVKNGKIEAVGQDLAIPQGATVIDAKGKYITPGFVALSMAGVGLRAGGGPGGGGGGPGQGGARASGKLADSLDPFDRNIKFCLGVGITTGCVDVSGGGGGRFGRNEADENQVCPCCGLTILPTEPITPTLPTAPTARREVVLKMAYGDLNSMLINEAPFHHLPASGLAGALNRFNWRENLRQAKKYVDEQAEHEKATKSGGTTRPPRRPAVPEELIRLVKKEIALRTDAGSVSQIRDMIQMAKEFDYKLVLESAHEAWLAAGELAEAKASVVLTPRARRRGILGNEDGTGSSIETSAYLEKTGVPFAIATQMNTVSLDGVYAGRDLTGLPLEAAFAVRGGCSEKTALAGLTIVPARILGLDSSIGSIEAGKDADLLIHNGPPLDYRTYVETAFVKGKVYYERNKDRVYPTFERSSK